MKYSSPHRFRGLSLPAKPAPLKKARFATIAQQLGRKTGPSEWIVNKAIHQAQRFQFSEAARTYSSYLRMIPNADLFRRAEALLKISNFEYRAAMQSSDSRSFRAGIQGALSTLRTAESCLRSLGRPARADLFRSRALGAFLEFWIAENPIKKGRLLDNSWSLAKKSLRYFEASRRYLDYAETYQQLSVGVGLSLESDWHLAARIRKCREAAEHGKRSIAILRLAQKKEELTQALVRTALFLDALSEITLESSRAPRFQQEAVELWKEAQAISKEIAYIETSRPPQGFYRILDQNQALSLYKEALRLVKPQMNRFTNGWLTEKLAKWSFYAAEAVENPALRVKGHVEALHYAEEAAKNFGIVNFTSAGGGVLWVHSPYAEHFHQLATYESNSNRRRALQEKSLRSIPELLRLAKQSGHPSVISYAFHIGAKSAVSLADMETSRKRKVRLLREGLEHRVQAVTVVGKIEPVPSWNMGIMLRYLAEIQAKLADLAETSQDQIEMLEKAALTQENGLKQVTDYTRFLERIESHVFRGPIGRYHYEHASVLQQLNSITQDQDYLRRAAQEYTSAADWFQRAERPSGAAECYWKSAETYDSLRAHALASDTFILAAEAYESLGKKISPLKDLSLDYARYLRAWSQIELARSMHQLLQYDVAARAYKNAARLHRSTRRWRFLAPYYSAWSCLESGENLSRNGQRGRAVEVFRKATDLFVDSTIRLKDRLPSIDQPDEKKMVLTLVGTPKKDYCQARGTLEEAMIAESKEDYQSSFEKFGLASEKLRGISERSEQKQDRDETGFLSSLCRAWQLSSKAELEDSVEILRHAATSFAQAKRISPSQTVTRLAQGHEEFCKALIASRRFGETLDPELQREASKHLDLASGYYLESGFKTAAYHALGRKLLLDAFAQLNLANTEEDPKKKAGLYLATISLLHESASAFRKAKQPRKIKRARELLKKARIESRISSHLTDILEAAVEAPTNVAFHTPAQGYEKPVGLERFDRADLEIRLSSVSKAAGFDRNVELNFEITNTGKQPIVLLRLEEALPDGTELLKTEDQWNLQGRSIVLLNHRRINPLQTEIVKLAIRFKDEGLLRINSKAVFADPGGTEQRRSLEPKIISTSRIVEFLADSFIRDYVSKRLAVPSCGWRTLMEIVDDLKIPRSHVYGEPRYGRIFGRQLDSLVKSSIAEYRIFQGERGRGGDITRVRVQLNNRDVREYLDQLAPGLGVRDPLSERTITAEDRKMTPQITLSP